MGIHDHHRDRLRRRFAAGSEGFEPHQLLELLLFYSVPRADTNPAAHALLDTFGGLREVLDAPLAELKKVPGIGENSALLIKLIQRMAVAYTEPDGQKALILHSSADAGAYLMPKFLGERDEVAYLLCLDAKGKLLGCSEVGRGGACSTELDFRRVVETALSRNAVGVILAHNHPSGVALPSHSDEMTTRNLLRTLRMMQITLMDHIIVSDRDWVSMADSGMLSGL